MKAWFVKALLLVGTLWAFTSCGLVKPGPGVKRPIAQSRYCQPAIRLSFDTTYQIQTNVGVNLQTDTALTKRYAYHDVVLANAVGILPCLQKLISLETNSTAGNQQEVTIIRQKILSRLVAASTQIASVAAELECEAERANRFATYLDQRDAGRIRRLTVISIVIGAATTVVTTWLPPDKTTILTGVGGGVLSAGFGSWAAFSSNRTVQLIHQRNLLTDVWFQHKQSTVFPSFVWYVLNENLFSYGGEHSISYNTRQRWQEYVLNGSTLKEQEIYFGQGGFYQSGNLHARAEMLGQLKAAVQSINQDLYSLVLNFSR
ncbi:hypothetical protein [Spirosoma arcticum]